MSYIDEESKIHVKNPQKYGMECVGDMENTLSQFKLKGSH